MIKILYVSHSSQIGGAEICLLNLLRGLDRSTFCPIVVFPSEGPLKDKITDLSIKTYITSLEWWVEPECGLSFQADNLSVRIRKLAAIIDREKPSIIHTNTSVIWEGAIVAKLKNIPHVWHIHEFLQGHPSLKPLIPLPLLYHLVELLSDKVVTVSLAVKTELSDYISLESLVTIYNGIDIPILTPSEVESVVSENDFTAVIVGQISKCKGHDTLLDAISLVKGKMRSSKFLVIGQGSDMAVSALLSNVERLNILEHVFYLGYRSDAARIIAQADVLILPSHREAFPTVILEAMALGKPVIATDCGGPSEMVIDGETGYVIPVNDPLSLSETILDAYLNRDKLKEMGGKGQRRFKDNFRLEEHVVHFEELYRQVLEKNRVSDIKELMLVEGIVQFYDSYVEKLKIVS